MAAFATRKLREHSPSSGRYGMQCSVSVGEQAPVDPGTRITHETATYLHTDVRPKLAACTECVGLSRLTCQRNGASHCSLHRVETQACSVSCPSPCAVTAHQGICHRVPRSSNQRGSARKAILCIHTNVRCGLEVQSIVSPWRRRNLTITR